MARGTGTGTQGVTSAPMFDNVQHAPVCRCARCKDRGENGWATQAVATSGSSAQVVAAPTATRVTLTPQQKAAAAVTPYCYNCGAVTSEPERGQLCSACTDEAREQGEAGLKARNDALVEMQQRYAPQQAAAPAAVMPSTGWPLGIPGIPPVTEPVREKPRVGVTVVFQSAQHHPTVVGHCPGGMVDHILVYHPDFSSKVTSFNDPQFWSACKYTAEQIKAGGDAWRPISGELVGCHGCLTVYETAGLLRPVLAAAATIATPAPVKETAPVVAQPEPPKARETRVEQATPVERAVATVNNEEVIRELATTLLGAVDQALLTLFDVQSKLSALVNTPTIEPPAAASTAAESTPAPVVQMQSQPTEAVMTAALEWVRVKNAGGGESGANKAASAVLRQRGLYPAAWNEMKELAGALAKSGLNVVSA